MMKIVFALVLGLLVLDHCHAKFDENILGAQGAELLKDLKESGVLENFEEELEKTLHDKVLKKDDKKVVNEDKVADNKKEAEGVKVDQGMADFIQSYVEEKDIVLDQRILDHLASLPITERAKHMVHLTQVLDVIFEIALLDKPELDVKVLEVIKRVQSLPVMKTSLNKLIRPQEQDKKSSKSSSSYSHPVSTNDVDLGVVSMIKDFILKLKAKPDFVFELILPTMVEYGLVSKDATTLLKMYGSEFIKGEGFASMLDVVANSVEVFGASAGGQRLVALLPDVLAADSMEAIMEIFQREAESSWGDFLGKLDNSDMAEHVTGYLASGMVHSYNEVRNLMKDEMKMMMANTFLISQGLPAIKPKKLTESLFNLVDKSLKIFTTYKLDLEEYKTETLKQIALIEKEQITLVSRFVTENVLEPVQLIWKAHRHISTHSDGPKCAESILCHLNAHMRSQGPIKITITKLISLAGAYGWSADDKSMDRWKLYQAIWNGNAPETKCATQYTPSGLEGSCHIFPWQEDMMSLAFEHTEL